MVFNEEGCSGISSGESDMSSDAIYSLFVDRGQNLLDRYVPGRSECEFGTLRLVPVFLRTK